MRYSLRLQTRSPLDRERAKACLIANVSLPGAGSLMAGRAIGYVQMTVALVGVLLTTLYGVRFILWFLEHRAMFQEPAEDPIEALRTLWVQVRLPLAGMILFFTGWLWSVLASLRLLWATPSGETSGAAWRAGG
jgi:hypothetical protein